MKLQKRNFLAWLRLQKRAMHVSLAAVALLMTVAGPFAQVARADFVSLTINNNTSGSFAPGQQWLLQMSSSFPSTEFMLCAIHPNGAQDCTPGGAFAGNGSTDASGGWSLFGQFPLNDPTVLGTWTEWAQFASGAQSNQVTFTVSQPTPPPAPSASLTINGTTGGSFTAGQGWALGVTSNFKNSTFNLCAIHPNGAQDCTPTNGMFTNGITDPNGIWAGQGTFPLNDPTVLGTWTEWAQFPSGFTSSRITFTVSAPAPAPSASMTINGATTGNFTLGQAWTLAASTNFKSQNVLLCAIHPAGFQDCSTAINGVPVPPTDANGNWSFAGSFNPADASIPGTWTEWLQFPSGFTSSRITFTVTAPVVTPAASLTINGVTTGSFTLGQAWTLAASTNFKSQSVLLCAIHPAGFQDCSTAINGVPVPQTDANGNWLFTGSFNPADTSIPGTWTEWLQFPSGFTSNRVTFTVTAPVVTPTASLTINGATTGNFTVGQAWTLTMSSNQPSQILLVCAIHPDGVQDCTPANSLFPGNDQTNASGAWTGSGNFPATSTGNWTEWIQFPSGFASNRITFTVAPSVSAGLTINGSISGNYFVGQAWTLRATSTFPSTAFSLCAIGPDGVQSCTPTGTLFPGNGSTDSSGSWTGSGNFPATSTGNWTEWAQFPSGATSNRIIFTVTAPAGTSTSTASLTINGVTNGSFVTGQAWILQSTSTFPNATFNVCVIHPDGLQDCTPASTLFPGNGQTNGSGAWTGSGNFPATSTGNWTEWLQFPSANNFISNQITFTVSPATSTTSSTVAVSLAPTSFNFAMQQGNMATVSPTNNFVTFTVNPNQAIAWTAQPNVTWIVGSSGIAQTTGTSQIVIAPAAASLTPGIYSGSLTFAPTVGAAPTFIPQTVFVTLTVLPVGCQVNCGGGGGTATTSTLAITVNGLQNNATATITATDVTANAVNIAGTSNGTVSFTLPINHQYAVAATTSAPNYTVGTSGSCAGTFVAGATCAVSFTLGAATSTGTSTTPIANLAITKTVDNAAPLTGSTVNYTLTVSALGPATSTGVTATDVLPSGVLFQNATASVGSYATSTGIWTIGTMSASSTATLRIAAAIVAGAGQVVTNTATVGESASSTNQNTSGSTASSTITVATSGGGGGGGTNADIAVSKTVDAAFPKAGDVVHYLVTVTALGPAASTIVVAHDLLPVGLSLVQATASQGVYSLGTGDWTIGTLNANATATLALATMISPNAAGQTIVNGATVSELSSLVDTNPANNSSSVSVFVQSTSTPTANISVSKSVDVATPAPNATVNYTVTVRALGPATSTGVVANDPLPSGLGFLTSTVSVGSYVSSTGVWTIGDMSAGSTATLQIAATVNVSAGSVIVNNATVGESASSTNVTGGSAASSTITVTTPGGGGGGTGGGGGGGGGGGAPTVGVGAGSGGTGGGLYYAFDIKINGGAPSTDSRNVTLTLSATGANQMWIANDPSLFATSTPTSSDSTGWIPFTGTYPWILSPGTGNKTVYAQFGNNRAKVGAAQAAIQLMGGGGGQVLGASTSTGEVLGASANCGLYLYDYIKYGRNNNPNEVKKLQTFLNDDLQIDLPISGFYGPMTLQAVNIFQQKYYPTVLTPWVPYGLPSETTPTGYVYKTTRRWINMLVCPPLGLPLPQLP